MNLEDEKDWSETSGIVSGTKRAIHMARERATAAFLAGRDVEARSFRDLASDLEKGIEHAETKLDLFIERSKHEARKATRRAV